MVFDYQKAPVRQFLVDNAKLFYDEYHVDGFRFDEVTVIDNNGGWGFCQQLTDALRSSHPEKVKIAEYWRSDPSWVFRATQDQGAGFDAVLSDVPRNAIRNAVNRAATSFGGVLDLGELHGSLAPRFGPGEAWRAVNCVENQDLVYSDHTEGGRIAHLADSTDARSWYAKSRSRVATALLLTAPGVPMLFMGQELLEYRPWNDNLKNHPDFLVHWNELAPNTPVGDFLLFTQAVVDLRKRFKGLRGFSSRPYHNPGNRVIAFHRWVEFEGWDVVVVASLSETTYYNYVLGFPLPGRWAEVFNSDSTRITRTRTWPGTAVRWTQPGPRRRRCRTRPRSSSRQTASSCSCLAAEAVAGSNAGWSAGCLGVDRAGSDGSAGHAFSARSRPRALRPDQHLLRGLGDRVRPGSDTLRVDHGPGTAAATAA